MSAPSFGYLDNFSYIRRATAPLHAIVKQSAVTAFSWIQQLIQKFTSSQAATHSAKAEYTHEAQPTERLRERIRKTYCYQPKLGVTLGTIKYATLIGDIVIIDVYCDLPHKVALGVFEVPISDFWNQCCKQRITIGSASDLIGKRIKLHTGRRYSYHGVLRSTVKAVEAIGSLPPRS